MKVKNNTQNALNLNPGQLVEFVLNSFDLSTQITLITEVLQHHLKVNKLHPAIALVCPKTTDRIAIPIQDGFEFVVVKDITRIEGDSNYVWIHHLQQGKFMISRTLKDFESKLQKFRFIRVHNSHLVNLNFIEKYSKTDGGHLIMRDGSLIPVSKRKKAQVQALFD